MELKLFRCWNRVANCSVVEPSRCFGLGRRPHLCARTYEVQFPGQAKSAAQTGSIAPAGAALSTVGDRDIVVDERNGFVVVQMLLDGRFDRAVEIGRARRRVLEVRRGRERRQWR